MNFDNTQIVIRERSYLELLDLALRVLRTQAAPLFLALLIGIGPFVVFNAWLLDRFVKAGPDAATPWLFLILSLAMVLWEFPLATGPATMCLGRALFNRPLAVRQIAREFAESLPQAIAFQVVYRGLMLVTVVGSVLPMIANPFLNEIIFLERNPMRAAGNNSISTSRRGKMLNRGQEGKYAIRWILNMAIGLVLIALVWGSLAAAAKVFFNVNQESRQYYTVMYPIALWTTAAYFTVVRFLSYLDLRIRHEGWDVELLMRAELDRWTRMPQAS